MNNKLNITTIDAYVQQFAIYLQQILQTLRSQIQEKAPDATECISYGIPTFKYKGINLVHFAAYKNHIGFYPTASGIANFAHKLTKYKSSKGAVQFPLSQPLPFDLIDEIVAFRLSEINSKQKNIKKSS